MVAHAEVVTHVRRDDHERIHPHGVPNRPGRDHGSGDHEYGAGVAQRSLPAETGDEPRDRQQRQEQKRDRPYQRGEAQQQTEDEQSRPAGTLLSPAKREEHGQRSQHQKDEQRLSQVDGGMEDQVREQRHPERRHQPDCRREQAASDVVDERDGGDAKEHLEEARRQHQVIRNRRVADEVVDGGQRRWIADGIVSGRAVRQRVAEAVSDSLAVTVVEDRIVQALGFAGGVEHPGNAQRGRQRQDRAEPA